MEKSADAYRTISEVAEDLKLPQHVLRFWETRFPQIKPMKRGGNRRFYRPGDVELLRAIKTLLYGDGFTIKGVQRILREQGPRAVASLAGSRQLQSSVRRQSSTDEFGLEPDRAGAGPDRRQAVPVGSAPPEPAAEMMVPVADASATAGPREPAELADALQAVLFELAECGRILAAART